MKTLTDQLSQYAQYHRSERNILTHFIGVPMIVAAVAVLLSRPALAVGGFTLTPALLAVVAASLFYLRLDLRFGLLLTALLAAALWFGSWAAAQSTAVWLAIGVGGFLVGWVIQFVGHHFEGRKPAFVDDVVGLLIGPLFVVAELLFLLGLCRGLKAAIESRAGATRA